MDEQLVSLKLCLDEVGGFNMEHFEDRLRVQKIVYLMQLFGVDLGYRFEWYLRGPYCTELTAAAFEAEARLNEIQEAAKRYKLRPKAREAIAQLNQLLQEKRPTDLSEVSWLELLASVHYLKHIAYKKPAIENNCETICERLSNMKPWFTREHIKAAWDTLDRYGLIDNRRLGEDEREIFSCD